VLTIVATVIDSSDWLRLRPHLLRYGADPVVPKTHVDDCVQHHAGPLLEGHRTEEDSAWTAGFADG
jgi:hypothetical protein